MKIVIITVFWDSNGIVFIEILHGQRTNNAVYYQDRVPIRNILLLPDNAKPQTAAITQQTPENLHWKTTEHTPYRPDLPPCNYHLFGPLKQTLQGETYNSLNKLA